MSQAEDNLDDAEINDLEEEADFRDGVDVSGRCIWCGEPKRYCLCHIENQGQLPLNGDINALDGG